ncbi:hypothetical protein SELMODRAFT_164856 [Selaginella moellendorffii]|uniref:Enoyl reductase (ER) domain-containing protein n=1 Tax=Selaginella moellendorffii TaxID=88036 RepID=D8QRP7_SELML|nr:alcohol dehydrogenase class-3 [Selaginella moellendorffii]EFJ37290.1 hypothetical protein SELMODRAFT_164856 [Selaginella moellendorffii]|eukprot:XP_002962030.1 alcohol dehydrogenase class-3 [Selaginella moellendorffii]
MAPGREIVCKAAVSWEPEQLSFEDIRVAPPQSGEVRVRIVHSSLCHTDITFWKGKGSFPVIFGHEGSGIVESVGENVDGVRPGDHVVSVFQPECQDCRYCKMPKTNLCVVAFAEVKSWAMLDGKTRFSAMDGTPIHHFLGCSTFSEYTVMHHSHVAKVDPSVALEKICLLSCGVPTGLGAAWNIAKVEAGSTVAVFGLGTVGLAVVEGAKTAGASRIIGVDIQPSKQRIGEDFGLTDFVNPKDYNDKPIHEVIHELSGGGVDYSFECVGNPKLMVDALNSLHAFGSLIIVGVTPEGQNLSFDPNILFFGRQILSGSLGGFKIRSQMPELVDKFMTGVIDLDRYITHNLPLSRISEGFGLLLEVECVKCVFSH